MSANRLSDYDVTGTVQVSDPDAVTAAVRDIFQATYPGEDFTPVVTAFRDFRRMFSGKLPGFLGCDTVYHDMQHTLDMTLATARLIGGYEKAHVDDERLGPKMATLGLVTALFHDSGYIRHTEDRTERNGAAYTRSHITRGANFLQRYLPSIGLEWAAQPATEIIHFTGYERPISEIRIDDPRERIVGQILATADLMAQMADRCYLEKCRDRLFPEFVLGGIAFGESDAGEREVRYESGLDLLKKTPEFFDGVTRTRLDGDFDGVYRYFESWFDGENPYLESVTKNLSHLEMIIETGDWESLRRAPPCFTHEKDSLDDTQTMVALKLKESGLAD